MRCINCGMEVDEKGKFCEFCGSELNGSSHCVLCGKEIARGEKICRKCLKDNRKKNKTIQKILILLLIVSIIALLVCGGFWFWCEWQDIFYTRNGMVDGDETVEIMSDDDNAEGEEDEEEYLGQPFFEKLEASSEYASYITDNGKRYTYYIYQIRDGERNTAWSPERDDEEPWFEFSDKTTQKVSGFIIENGYSKSEDLYYQNLRAKDILIECDDFEMEYTLSDRGCRMPEKVKLDEPVITKKLKITVLSVYDSEEIDGVKYDDLSISEFDIF